MNLVNVKFVRSWRYETVQYNKGDPAGFPEEIATDLVEANPPIAELYDKPSEEQLKKERAAKPKLWANVQFLVDHKAYRGETMMPDGRVIPGDKAGFVLAEAEWLTKNRCPVKGRFYAKMLDKFEVVEKTHYLPPEDTEDGLPPLLVKKVECVVERMLDKKLDEKLAPIMEALKAKGRK